MDKHLHIVTHEIPFPVKHGGLVDLFYKLVYLHKLGVSIHLHCFTSTNKQEIELNKYCASVQYYKRKEGLGALTMHIPYIVYSRRSERLLKALQNDNYPVLLEGIHCTWMLFKNQLKNRAVFVRLHNVESTYYEKLGKWENNIFKQLYFKEESRRLQKYEAAIADKATYLTVSRQDLNWYKKKLGATSIHFLPVFLPHDTVTTHPGQGCYCLYHGNLSVNENEKAALWLLDEVFNDLSIPFVIAGLDPSAKLKVQVNKNANCCLTANPNEMEMQDLIGKAQINILPSFNNTGVKLKILNALYNGRHCLVNDAAIEGAVINDLCHTANTPLEFKEAIKDLFNKQVTPLQIQERQYALQGIYDNEKNALHLMTLIW